MNELIYLAVATTKAKEAFIDYLIDESLNEKRFGTNIEGYILDIYGQKTQTIMDDMQCVRNVGYVM